MRKVLFLLIAMLLASGMVFASGSSEASGSITLMQNKPEIDAMLQEYGAAWSEETGIGVTIKSVGGSSGTSLGQQLRADYAAGEMPDIFVIAGIEDYREWESVILDLSGEEWVDETSVAFAVDGTVYGFPVAIEGWGMAYNAEILDEAGVDPDSLTNYDAYRAAFEKIDGMKDELGLDSVVSMAASADMGWVTAHHNFNSLLSNGLPYDDTSVVDELKAGEVDRQRLSEYADWVELLFDYAEPAILTTGNYDAQVGAFATEKAAFLHQGNWVDPNMDAANATFEMAFAPHGSMKEETEGIFVSAPSFYVINAESENIEAAKRFLNDMVFTDAGQEFMVNEAGMIPAYKNVELNPPGQLSRSVQNWAAEGKVYAWNQYQFSGEFRDQTLAPIYNQFATGRISKQQFVEAMTEAFESLQ
ncbi:MAG: ABC transporter substrate-binding protein [Alkalispirochaetaceae bacterium]